MKFNLHNCFASGFLGVVFGVLMLGLPGAISAQTLVLDFDFEQTTTPVVNDLGGTFSTVGTLNGPTWQNGSDQHNYLIECDAAETGWSIAYTGWNDGDALRFTFNTLNRSNLHLQMCKKAVAGSSFVMEVWGHDGTSWLLLWPQWGVIGAWDASWGDLPSNFNNKSQVMIEVRKKGNAGSAADQFRLDNFRIFQTSCSHPDKAALIELYEAMDGDNWTNTWDTTTCNICDWYGVICNGSGRVTSINLNQNNLQGNLPNLNLPLLENLALAFNNISGSLPNFNLPNLRTLALPGNQLSGSIPNFSDLPTIQDLVLRQNQLTGSIPNFSNLPLLLNFEASENQLSGSLPNFNNLPGLQNLSLSGNLLSGAISNFNLPALQQLALSHNLLSGTLPNFNLPNLQMLVLHDNQLIGSLPAALADLNALLYLDLHNNGLTGCLPLGLQSLCSHLLHADIGNNPGLATQDWGAFCSMQAGACLIPNSNGSKN